MKGEFKLDFAGIGVPKAATTWIYECLKEHPEICCSSKKEVSFFYQDRKYKKGINYYASFFDNCEQNQVIGEYSPQYLASEKAPQRIKKHFPDVKFIACLRNPIERAYSHYWYSCHQGRMRSSLYDNFEDAIKSYPPVLEHGFYYKHLTRWFEFFPRGNFKIVFYEDLRKSSVDFIRELYDFLGVDKGFDSDLVDQKVNTTKELKKKRDKVPFIRSLLLKGRNYLRWTPIDGIVKKLNKKTEFQSKIKALLHKNTKKTNQKVPSRPPLKKKKREILQEIYAEDIRNLEDLLKKDLSGWKYEE